MRACRSADTCNSNTVLGMCTIARPASVTAWPIRPGTSTRWRATTGITTADNSPRSSYNFSRFWQSHRLLPRRAPEQPTHLHRPPSACPMVTVRSRNARLTYNGRAPPLTSVSIATDRVWLSSRRALWRRRNTRFGGRAIIGSLSQVTGEGRQKVRRRVGANARAGRGEVQGTEHRLVQSPRSRLHMPPSMARWAFGMLARGKGAVISLMRAADSEPDLGLGRCAICGYDFGQRRSPVTRARRRNEKQGGGFARRSGTISELLGDLSDQAEGCGSSCLMHRHTDCWDA